MSIKQYPGGIITKNPTAPTTSSAKGIWTLDQAQNYTKQGIWPRSPGAPTIGTATAVSSSSATVTFTAPTDLGNGSITYSAISTPGCYTGSGTSPITVTGLGASTSYTFRVTGTTPGGTGPASAASNSITTPAAAGQQAFTSVGTFSWVAPAGVTKVSVVAVGGGGGGGGAVVCCGIVLPIRGGNGGGLGYKNNITVVPGNSYTVVVGTGGIGNLLVTQRTFGCSSYFCSTSVVRGGGATINCSGPGTFTGDGGGNGGSGPYGSCNNGGPGGGGAGGYSGAGGAGGSPTANNATAGAGGGGGGGGGGNYIYISGGGGGGVGLLGSGSNGTAGTRGVCVGPTGGGGGSSGASGGCGVRFGSGVGGVGGAYGAGGGGGSYNGGSKRAGAGGSGAVRIIWPGNTRSFPSTCTGDI